MFRNNFLNFIEAVKRGDVKTVAKLFQFKFIEKELDGQRPIHFACQNGHMDIVKMLLESGCDMEVADKNGRRPIHWACCNGHVHIVKMLLECGCDKDAANENGGRIIHWACKNGHVDIVKMLLERGCDMKATDESGWRPIHWACWNKHVDIVKMLLESGCDMDVSNENRGRIIHWTCKNGYSDIVKMQLENGYDIEAEDENGGRPIHWACWNGHVDIVKMLLETGCDIEAADKNGRRPIHRACWNGHADIVQQLLDRGGQMEAVDSTGYRPIHYASIGGHSDAVELLIDKGCVIDAQTKFGKTPLDLAWNGSSWGIGRTKCVRMIEEAREDRKKDEFKIFHLPTVSIVSRKYKIYDLPDAVEKIKTCIPCINRPTVVCHLRDPLRRLAPSQKAFRIVCYGLQYAEYFVEDAWENKDWQSQMAELRDWNVRVVVNSSTSEIKLKINKSADQSKWRQYTTVSFDVTNEQSQFVTETVNMLVMDKDTGADVKVAFLDFQRFACYRDLFESLAGNQADNDDGTNFLNKTMTTRKEMLTFYDSNREKIADSNPIFGSNKEEESCRISVVQKAPRRTKFVQKLSEAQHTMECITEIMFEEKILIRCITDDDLGWIVLRRDCKNVADVEKALRPLVLNDSQRGRLMLVGTEGQLPSETEIDNVDSVIYYAVILPYENVTKVGNIGRGSYGLVSRCKIGNEEAIYAVKEIEKYDNESEDDRKSMINEVMVAARVRSHPNVVKYRRFYENDLGFYIVMDCMQVFPLALNVFGTNCVQESMDNHISKNKCVLSEAAIVSFSRQILEGLKHLHDQKVIHRDVKCRNVLVDGNGCVKLCDFGVSKCQNVNTNEAAGKGGATQAGTQRYMAPELIGLDRPNAYGQSADVWSFGLVMVKMITGKEPFPDLSDTQVHLRLKKDRKVEYEFPAIYSAELKQFVDSCLIYNLHDRPTCGKLLQNAIFTGKKKNN